MAHLTVRRIGYPLGAEIRGVDLREDFDDATFDVIRRAGAEHLLLCFPDQDISREDLIRLAGRFGVVDDNSSVKHRDTDNPYVTMLTSKPFDGKPWETFKNGDNWHTDRSFKVTPTSWTMLSAREIPPVGGDTMFANQYIAYDSLSPKLRAFCDDLQAIHLQTRKASAMMAMQFPAVVHPLVRVHPETGKKALYLGEHVRGFLEMTEEESKPFLDYLSFHATRPEFIYRHRWSVHDVVMWDNRCLMHVAVKDYVHSTSAAPRHLWKCSVQGQPTGRRYEDVVGHKYPLELAERPEAATQATQPALV